MDIVWKEVPSFPGVLANNLGQILLPEKIAKMPNGGERVYKTKPTYGYVAKASKTAKHTYLNVCNRYFGNIKVHRAVCEAFHGKKPFEDAVVIHLDENALNNRPENLKWATQKENLNCEKFIEYCKSRKGEDSPVFKSKLKKLKEE